MTTPKRPDAPTAESPTPTRPSLVRRVLGAIRDGWLVIGITILLFLTVEFTYWLYRTVRQSMAKPPAAQTGLSRQHPYYGMSWHNEEYEEGIKQRPNAFDIYRGFWPSPVQSRYVNSDSAARRVTPQPTFDPAIARRVFMFGGSTMWGNSARDSFTIPSQVAARLAARGITNVEIVNYGQRGYNTTQEAITLLYEVARNNEPDLAIFFNGHNDASIAIRAGQVGASFGQDVGQQMVDLGRRGFWGELFGLGRHSPLIQRLREMIAAKGADRLSRLSKGDRICQPVAEYYRRMALSVEAIGQAHGFQTLYFLQPLHVLTRKPLTVWEKSLWDRALLPEEDLKVCMLAIDSAMQDRFGRTYFRSYDLFDQDTTTVFIDAHSHITETANGIVADQITNIIAPLLEGMQHRP